MIKGTCGNKIMCRYSSQNNNFHSKLLLNLISIYGVDPSLKNFQFNIYHYLLNVSQTNGGIYKLILNTQIFNINFFPNLYFTPFSIMKILVYKYFHWLSVSRNRLVTIEFLWGSQVNCNYITMCTSMLVYYRMIPIELM